jgi:hypothetical protein
MRRLLIATVLVVSGAVAQDDPFKQGDALQAEVSTDCKEGCVVLNRQQASELERQFEVILARKMKEAFDAGVAYQKQACRSLI